MKPLTIDSRCITGCGRALKENAQLYCSLRCQQRHRRELRYRAFVASGGCHGYVPYRFLKQVLIRLIGARCSRCGWAQVHPKTGTVPVETEHLDGNWENNRLENLTLLCPNCHSLTDTYRGMNRGHGRPYRLGSRKNPYDPGKVASRIVVSRTASQGVEMSARRQ